jgi:hypothetical protein
MSQAPEDATHVNAITGQLFRYEGSTIRDYWDGEWHPTKPDNIRDSQNVPLVYARVGSASVTPRIAAHEFLERGVKHMRDRAVQRDSDAGERSMARAVAAFNAQEGTNITEAQGWRFMIQLKYARAVNGVFVADDYEDMAAYAGLAGEAAQ